MTNTYLKIYEAFESHLFKMKTVYDSNIITEYDFSKPLSE